MKPIIGWITGWSFPQLRKDIRQTYSIKRTKKAAKDEVGFPYRATRIKITIERIAAGEKS